MVASVPSGRARAVVIGTTSTDGSGDDELVGAAVAAAVADADEGGTLASALGTAVGWGVADGSGTGGEPRFWGSGTARTTKSAALSSVSCVDPASPPGRRSRLEP